MPYVFRMKNQHKINERRSKKLDKNVYHGTICSGVSGKPLSFYFQKHEKRIKRA